MLEDQAVVDLVKERERISEQLAELGRERDRVNKALLEACFEPGTARSLRKAGGYTVIRQPPVWRCFTAKLVEAGVKPETIARTIRTVSMSSLAKEGVDGELMQRCVSNPDARTSLRVNAYTAPARNGG